MNTLERIIQLAQQFTAFLATGHIYTDELNPPTRELIATYIRQLPALTLEIKDPVDGPFPVEWIESRARLRSGIARFRKFIAQHNRRGPLDSASNTLSDALELLSDAPDLTLSPLPTLPSTITMAGPLDDQRGSKDPPTPPPQGHTFTEG